MATRTETDLLIRADANTAIGYGHFMRCLALAQACRKKGFSPCFVSNCDSQVLKDRLLSENLGFIPILKSYPENEDLEILQSAIEDSGAQWVVADGYSFDSYYWKQVRSFGCHLLVIDDLADQSQYPADIILNQNIYAGELKYACPKETIQLMGLRFVLLREEFIGSIQQKRQDQSSRVKNILITMGGSDPNHVSLSVIRALASLKEPDLKYVVVIGNSNPHKNVIQREIHDLGNEWRVVTDPEFFNQWMTWADIAISGGGSTCYELAGLGTPSLIIGLAENQRMLAASMAESGAARYLGWFDQITPEQIAAKVMDLLKSPEVRKQMASIGRELVDGMGSARVAQWMRDLSSMRIRRATLEDSRMVFEWANDALTRSVSFSHDVIQWEDHQQWYQHRMDDPGSKFFIAFNYKDAALGIVRFQIEENKAIASINLSPDQRGKGYGSQFLRLASKRLFQESSICQIDAFIKPDNAASVRAFMHAGYHLFSPSEFQGHPADLYILRREEL